jgi:hypothetical protein
MAVVYNPRIVTDGLLLHIDAGNPKCYPGSGVTLSNIVSTTLATNISGATFDSTNFTTLSYDGINDYTLLPVESIPSGTQITVAVWINITTVGGNSVFWVRKSDGNRTINAHIPWSDNTVYWDCGDSGGSYDRISKATTVGERTGWHYWVFTKNANSQRMSIYLDGILWHSGTGRTFNISSPSFGSLGSADGSYGGGHFYSGRVGLFSMYNIELDAGQIQQNFNATRNRFGL